MSVNKIDFTLGSYNPNQAAGLIAMARENDRQISDSLKGILDGFEKTARENADVQAMNYINSLGLEDMTPDKMAGHTQALQQIAGSMGGLNPSKEALTALDDRGDVLTQRAINDVSLATNQHNWKVTKDEYDYKTQLPVIADASNAMGAANHDISILDNAIRNFAGDKTSDEYELLKKQKEARIVDYARAFEAYTNASSGLSDYYKNNLPHNVEMFNKSRETETHTATNNLNNARDIQANRAADLYATGVFNQISQRFRTGIGENGEAITIDVTTGKPVTAVEMNSLISDILDGYNLTGDSRTRTMNLVMGMQTKAEEQEIQNLIKLKGIQAKTDAAKKAAETAVRVAEIGAESREKVANINNEEANKRDSKKVSLTNSNLHNNKAAHDLGIHTWADENGGIDFSKVQVDVSDFIKSTNAKVATGYFNSKKGEIVQGGLADWYMSDEASKLFSDMEAGGYVDNKKSVSAFNNYFNNAPKEILDMIPTTAHKVEFIKQIATAQHRDRNSPLTKLLLYPVRGGSNIKPLNLILGLNAYGRYTEVFRPEEHDTIVKAAAIAASNAVKDKKKEYILNYLNPRFKVLADAASLNGGLQTTKDVIRAYGLDGIEELHDLYDLGGSEVVKNLLH
ncbi:hypothetical protein [Moraxella bovoculi]|uniref:hypothetical protein n=1 Tax=Moraxella bovoculi TaxID=386891 RepID=UPI000624559E|nr:hypothetical protein [Moraxella bovoculi]AKG13512.1 hypothetical protein AAX11_05080 [Moraxella bovoculi]